MVKVNEVHLATVLAEGAMKDEILVNNNDEYPDYNDESDLIMDDPDENDMTVYKEDVQVVFDRWYDYFYNIIMEVSNLG